MDVSKLTISHLKYSYNKGDLSPVDVIKSLKESIDNKDGNIGGYLSYDFDLAIKDAKNADISLPLGGIPIAIKDLINVKGHTCSCASKILKDKYTSTYDATVIRKLKEAGAIPFGRTNMDEFAMGSSNENSGIKPCKNPHDLDRIPGGSSGGSAAVVASDTAIASLGTDTGGSIRQPASLCGVVGLKPSYGRVSRYGLVAFASSLDQCGPLTKTVEDSASILQVIAGACKYDSTTIKAPVDNYLESIKNRDIKGMKIGVPKEYFTEGLDLEVRFKIEESINELKSLGADIIDISLPNTKYAVATYYILATAEASSNLARFDGIRYGHRAKTNNLLDLYKKSREEGFGSEVKRRILLGTFVLSSGYYDAYYLKAQKVRKLIQMDFDEAFKKVDFVVSPVSPTVAFKFNEKMQDPISMYLSDIYTIPSNLASTCGISIPCGSVNKEGKNLPVGLHIIANKLRETDLFRVSNAYEKHLKGE